MIIIKIWFKNWLGRIYSKTEYNKIIVQQTQHIFLFIVSISLGRHYFRKFTLKKESILAQKSNIYFSNEITQTFLQINNIKLTKSQI